MRRCRRRIRRVRAPRARRWPRRKDRAATQLSRRRASHARAVPVPSAPSAHRARQRARNRAARRRRRRADSGIGAMRAIGRDLDVSIRRESPVDRDEQRGRIGKRNESDAQPLPHLKISAAVRSEEHTSELQSLTNLVCRLLLEKKKKKKINIRLTHVKYA